MHRHTDFSIAVLKSRICYHVLDRTVRNSKSNLKKVMFKQPNLLFRNFRYLNQVAGKIAKQEAEQEKKAATESIQFVALALSQWEKEMSATGKNRTKTNRNSYKQAVGRIQLQKDIEHMKNLMKSIMAASDSDDILTRKDLSRHGIQIYRTGRSRRSISDENGIAASESDRTFKT